MSEPVQTPLSGYHATFGAITLAEAPAQGMVTLRADLSDAKVLTALQKTCDLAPPTCRQISRSDSGIQCAWMSPDEALIITPPELCQTTLDQLATALAGQHALVADVSDARCHVQLHGPDTRLRDLLSRLAPVDFDPTSATGGLPVGYIRRSRLAQIAAAIWSPETGQFDIIAFRSVAVYLRDLLQAAAKSPDSGRFTKSS